MRPALLKVPAMKVEPRGAFFSPLFGGGGVSPRGFRRSTAEPPFAFSMYARPMSRRASLSMFDGGAYDAGASPQR